MHDLVGLAYHLPGIHKSAVIGVGGGRDLLSAHLFGVEDITSWPSRPGEFHPEPLTEPDVNLSIHPARATHRRLPPSVETDGLLRSPVGPLIPTRVTPSLRSVGITPRHRYYGGVRPWAAHRYFRPRGFSTCVFSLGIAVQVLKFRTKAQIGVTPPLHRTPHGQ